MFERQPLHLAFLLLLLAGLWFLAGRADLTGEFLGLASRDWLVISAAIPILHQLFVGLAWRAELHRQVFSGRFGRDRGFALFAAGFMVLFAARPLAIIALALANRNTLAIPPLVAAVTAAILLPPSLYLGYSVARYFGVRRAMGIDHFDPAFREIPFVKKGIFRFTSNGMYTFGFLPLWLPGLLLLSQAALLAAAFSHLYIWVHYFCTELPDMQRIYGPAE